LLRFEAGQGCFCGNSRENAEKSIGAVQGGYAATLLLDDACGVRRAFSPYRIAGPIRHWRLLSSPITADYEDTGLLRAEGAVLSFGPRVAFADPTDR